MNQFAYGMSIILIFSGAGGHRNEVLSVDFHPSDIYRITKFWIYVEQSFTWTDLPSKFPTKYVQFPVFTASIHSNYVDCNRWLGDFILSKVLSSDNPKFGYNAATGDYEDLMAAGVIVEIKEPEPMPAGNPMDNSSYGY
ncbi:hypothetical protein SO802_031803 [Lithocarpus litseifolius]|uniref:Uncharacterized protein n=1 Tax=Lithocarpus litseifolius TaxID=425828 RepID=A0AAW2BNY7_9ROSI